MTDQRKLTRVSVTPGELAEHMGIPRREVISFCMQRGVAIYEGRIDRTVFEEKWAEVQPWR